MGDNFYSEPKDCCGQSLTGVPDLEWEARMISEEKARRRLDIVPHIVALIGVGWSLEGAIEAGKKLIEFVEATDGNAA